jgi:hypothetical protein
MCSKIQQNQEGGLLKEACSLLPKKSSLHIFKLRQVHRQSRPVKRENVTISIHQTGTICHNEGEDHQRHLKGERRAATVQRDKLLGQASHI